MDILKLLINFSENKGIFLKNYVMDLSLLDHRETRTTKNMMRLNLEYIIYERGHQPIL